MSYSEMIHVYFDEGLDGFLEDVLFEKLAENLELRREFTEHLRLHMIVRQDAAASAPPVQVTQALFSALHPAGPGPVPISRKAVPGTRPARWPSHAFTSAVSVLSVLLLVWFIRPFASTRIEYVEKNPPVVPGLQDTSVQTSIPHVTAPPVHASRVSSTDEITGAASTPSARAVPEPEALPVDAMAIPVADVAGAAEDAPVRRVDLAQLQGNDDPGHRDAVASEAGAPALARIPPAMTDGESPMKLPATLDLQTTLPTAIADIPDFPVADAPDISVQALDRSRLWGTTVNGSPVGGSDSHGLPDFLSHFIIEMRVMNGKSNPQVNLPYSSANLFKDIAFGLAYKIDDRNAVGIEYGRETFGQEYTSYEMETDPLVDIVIKSQNELTAPWMPKIYTRNMLLDWFGASWKVSFKQFEMLSMIYPYMRTFVGTTKQGPIGKMRIGLEIAPTKYTMFNIGFEGSFLRYEVEKMWNRTTKFGITAGLVAGF